MKKFSRQFYLELIPIALIILFLLLSNRINTFNTKPKIVISKQESALNLNPEIVDFFSMGYRRFITSIVWISTILESDHEHYKKKDNNSWMFLRFNFISQLDEKFYENYAFGGPYLSIIKDDDVGAKIIYDKGLKIYPNDYDLILNAGFHYYFELNDLDKSVVLYSKLREFPQTPPHILSLTGRLISESGSLQDAYNLVLELYQKTKDNPAFELRYRRSLYAIKAEIDLNCLNTKKMNCEYNDFAGNPYVLKNGTYQAKEQWTPFRILRKNFNE